MDIQIAISEAETYTLTEALFVAARYVSTDTATEFELIRKTIKNRLVDATAAFMVTATDDELVAWSKANNVDLSHILVSRGQLRAVRSRG
jgi:hypothetical protein